MSDFYHDNLDDVSTEATDAASEITDAASEEALGLIDSLKETILGFFGGGE